VVKCQRGKKKRPELKLLLFWINCPTSPATGGWFVWFRFSSEVLQENGTGKDDSVSQCHTITFNKICCLVQKREKS